MNLERQGIINPNGSRPSTSGVRIGAWKYCLFNPDKALEVFRRRFDEFPEGEEEEWLDWLDSRALAFLTTKIDRYIDWRKKVYDPYKEKICQGTQSIHQSTS